MSAQLQTDPAGARLVDRLHNNIASLVDGNHVDRKEVVKVGGRHCPCHLVYEVEWTFVAHTAWRRMVGNKAVSTHFGYNRRQYETETAHRCEIGRTHQPIRDDFTSSILSAAGASLGNAGQSQAVWDFGQHSVHDACQSCHASGRVTCNPCIGSGRVHCYRCHGAGTTTETRWVSNHNGQGRHQTYQQTCYTCGGSGRIGCNHCAGSGKVSCSDCEGHGFFTEVMTVTVQAEPHVNIITRSTLSPDALSAYLVKLPVAQAVRYLDFTLRDNQATADDRWQVVYDAHTIVAELDLRLRKKAYTAAAVGEQALAFIRPPIFDDVFIEEITDLRKIWSGKKKTFSNDKARKFFETYQGQPVLDQAMQAVAKLKGQSRQTPRRQVQDACQGYISDASAELLGKGMMSLLDKVSPPHSLWSWGVVMALPMLLLALGAQNWFENQAPEGHWALFFAWLGTAMAALALTLMVSPLAAAVSAVVSAVRRQAVPAEYRQHGRNWHPLRAVLAIAVVTTSLGGALGWMTHMGLLPRWNNIPTASAEKALGLQDLAPYVSASGWLHSAGFFLASADQPGPKPEQDPVLTAIQNNLRKLGYRVTVTGHMDELTQRAMTSFAKQRKVKVNVANPREVLATLCTALKGRCVKETHAP